MSKEIESVDEDLKIEEGAIENANTAIDLSKELETAAKLATETAKEVSQRLLHGAAEARGNLSALIGKISLFGNDGKCEENSPAPDIRQLLQLKQDQAILESFRCKLLQRYTANNNNFTPSRTIAFSGILYMIGGGLLAFVLDALKDVSPITVATSDLKGFVQLPAENALPARLEVQLGMNDETLVFGGFALGEIEIESASVLLEQLTRNK